MIREGKEIVICSKEGEIQMDRVQKLWIMMI